MRPPRGRVPAIGPDGDLAVAQAHQDLRARADELEAAEIEEEQERRGIEPAQRAVEREGRQRERRGEALRRHDLEDIAGADVVLGRARPWPRNRASVRVRDRRSAAAAAGPRPGGRGASGPSSVGDASLRAARARAHRRRGATPAGGRTGVTSEISSGTDVEDRHHRRAHQHRVGHAERVGIGRAAAPSAGPCRSRDSRTRRRPSAAGRAAASMRESAISARSESSAAARTASKASRSRARARLISARPPLAAPDQVGLEADDRIAARARRRLRPIRTGRCRRRVPRDELQQGRDRRLQIGDQPPADQRRSPAS